MNEDSATNDFNTRHIVDINTVNELKVKLAKQLHRSDLINIVSKNYINVISKQIMLASVSDMSKSEKIRYLQDIHSSRIYINSKQYYKSSELLFPIRLIIKELDNERYENVLNLGKILNVFWNNLDGLRNYVRYKIEHDGDNKAL